MKIMKDIFHPEIHYWIYHVAWTYHVAVSTQCALVGEDVWQT